MLKILKKSSDSNNEEVNKGHQSAVRVFCGSLVFTTVLRDHHQSYFINEICPYIPATSNVAESLVIAIAIGFLTKLWVWSSDQVWVHHTATIFVPPAPHRKRPSWEDLTHIMWASLLEIINQTTAIYGA